MKVTCKYFKDGKCNHEKAPVLPWYKRMLGKISCILCNNADIRILDCKFRDEIAPVEKEKK
jgi:hypothetical protein